jgi:Ni,Fe-hydrogenase III large subunit/NADH:ubiquinone oxidoreductase subunit C
MMSQQTSEIKNNSVPLDLQKIPVMEYDVFYNRVSDFLKEESRHCINYYGVKTTGNLKFYFCLADDNSNNIIVFSHEHTDNGFALKSLTTVCSQLHIFEREIHENFGVEFDGHPWLKPVRYAHDRFDKSRVIENYPFYEIESEELHEVGVGPIHAGVIEPGHFRFICNGEKVLHLEMQLGYQHRGIEKLFVKKNDTLRQCILSESIAGDTAVGHALANSQLIESLAGFEASERLQIERCIALELERVAVHIGDTAALCGDIAYQLGQVVCEALRTTIININQLWCGNRFGKGLIRPGGSNYPLNNDVTDEMQRVLVHTGRRFSEITDRIYSLPSVLARFEDIGRVSRQQALSIGAVGMAARTCNISRDIRKTHPFQFYKRYPVRPVVLETGDVYARGMLRNIEVGESVKIISELLEIWRQKNKDIQRPAYDYKLKPYSFAISMVEGWRGEICHSALTNGEGIIEHYKVKDPSMHNWMALALAVRNQEISDFPVCNKSFNLSYCGSDL